MLMTQWKNLHKKLAINLKFITQRAKIYYDKKRFEENDLKMKKKSIFVKKDHQNHKKKRQIESCQN